MYFGPQTLKPDYGSASEARNDQIGWVFIAQQLHVEQNKTYME